MGIATISLLELTDPPLNVGFDVLSASLAEVVQDQRNLLLGLTSSGQRKLALRIELDGASSTHPFWTS